MSTLMSAIPRRFNFKNLSPVVGTTVSSLTNPATSTARAKQFGSLAVSGAGDHHVPPSGARTPFANKTSSSRTLLSLFGQGSSPGTVSPQTGPGRTSDGPQSADLTDLSHVGEKTSSGGFQSIGHGLSSPVSPLTRNLASVFQRVQEARMRKNIHKKKLKDPVYATALSKGYTELSPGIKVLTAKSLALDEKASDPIPTEPGQAKVTVMRHLNTVCNKFRETGEWPGLNVEEGGRSITLDPTKSPIDSAYLSLFTPLSEEGRAQANILRKNVEKPDLVLLSQLPRTMETAGEVYGAAVVETDESRGFFRFSDGTSVPYEKYEILNERSLADPSAFRTDAVIYDIIAGHVADGKKNIALVTHGNLGCGLTDTLNTAYTRDTGSKDPGMSFLMENAMKVEQATHGDEWHPGHTDKQLNDIGASWHQFRTKVRGIQEYTKAVKEGLLLEHPETNHSVNEPA